MARSSFLSFLPKSSGSPAVETSAPPPEPLLLLRNFEESGRGWFWSTDADARLTYVSDSLASLLEVSVSSLLGKTLQDLFLPPDDSCDVRDRLPFVLGKRKVFDKIVLQTAQEDNPRWWEVSGKPCYSGSGDFLGYRGFSVDVTEQLQSSQSASQLALFDTLTGLPNRLNMMKFLKASMSGVEQAGRSCTVLLIDLDRFKQVNDSLGHPAGDALLKNVASRLLKIIGDKDKIFRLGGDEFQVILPNCEDRNSLGELAHRIISTLSQPYSIDGNRCVIGASIGLAVAPYDGRTGDDLVRNADLALYAAKANGRGCFQFFASSLLQVAEDRRVLENDLSDALMKGELSLFYQPQVCARTSCVTGVEALVRWYHPTRGAVSPGVFIPIAEDANLIGKLGEWILRKACDDAVKWPGNIKVAVNVSPIQFEDPNLPAIVISALANSGLPPHLLELELTEGIFLSESVETETMFSNLKDIGVRLALDDFGTGYSSLGYLRTAPFDKIKIDQSFVRGATMPGSRNGAIIAAIVALAGALDMETTAEGIETLDQLDLIRDLGVSHIQGYVYSKPISNDDLSQQIADGDWQLSPSGPAKQRSERRSLLRKAGAIIGNYYHAIIIRNISESGVLVEGMPEVPLGTMIAIDLGDCQLEMAVVRRADKRGYGVEFVEPLVSDGMGGLGTSRRVSPYALSKMGLSSSDYMGESRVWDESDSTPLETLARTLGLKMPPNIATPIDGEGQPSAALETSAHQRVKQFFVGNNPLQSLLLRNSNSHDDRNLSPEEWERLKAAVESSQNSQLKYIIALVVLTGARLHELMATEWDHLDLEKRIWTIPAMGSEKGRQIPLSTAAMDVIGALPRFDDVPHMIVNPRTKRPYNSFYGSWDAARKKAGLDHLSIHELRRSIRRTW